MDYTHTFAQAKINEEVYIDPLKGFQRKDKQDLVFKLLKSLYGLKQALKILFDKISEGLKERGFVQSELHKCLFMKKNMICVVYVDDTIIVGPDSSAIEDMIKSLVIVSEEQCNVFELRDEGEVTPVKRSAGAINFSFGK